MEIQLRETDAAYIAGILDGEGYITMNREKRHRIRKGDVVYDYIPRVDITQARKELLEHIGRLLETDYHIRKTGREGRYYRLSLTAIGIKWLLPQVIPFLVLKKDQARLVLECARIRTERANKHQYTDEALQKAEAMYWQIRAQNSLEMYWAKQNGLLVQ